MSNFVERPPSNYSFKGKTSSKKRLSIWQKIVVFLLVLLIVSSLIIIKIQADQLNDYQNAIYSMQTQIATQQAENVMLKTQIATQQTENALLKTQITTLESKINSLTTPTQKP